MPGLKVNSIANPVAGSAAFDHGTKAVASYITFSVGALSASPSGFITTAYGESSITATIENGIIEFSHPQTHSMVGVGDKVVLPSVTVYLNKKITTSIWEVRIPAGVPENITTPVAVTSINKTFSSLFAAINGNPPSSGAATLLGTTNLKSIRTSLRLALYAQNESVTSTITLTNNWVCDEECNIQIFTPTDISTECNSRQRHNGVAGSGYKLDVAAGIIGIYVYDYYVKIEGLHIDGGSNTDNALIKYGINLVAKTKILNNILSNAQYGIFSNLDFASNQVVAGNIIYGMSSSGIESSTKQFNIYNNTIARCGNGIKLSGSGDAYVVNNLVQNCSTACIDIV